MKWLLLSVTGGSPDVDDLLAARIWSGFEPESMTDAQLLESLGLDYLEQTG